MTGTSTPELLRDRATRLYTYLRELALLKSTVVRNVSDYEERFWFHDLPNDEAIQSILRGSASDGSDSWVEIRRRDEPKLPPLPLLLAAWVDSTRLTDSSVEPTIRDSISVRMGEDGEQLRVVNRIDEPDVDREWERYLLISWNPWALEHRRWSELQRRYNDLFRMHQQVQKLGEAYELVLGMGLLVWKTPSGQLVRRHVLAGNAETSFEAERGVLTVAAAGDGVRLRFETEMLEVHERPQPTAENELARDLDPLSETPWDRAAVERLLRKWINSLDSGSEYDPREDDGVSATNKPVLLFAPAIILRKRSGRNLVAAFEKIIESLKAGGVIPGEVQRLCAIESQVTNTELSPSPEAARGVTPELLFPLAANSEQLQIAERIQSGRGVIVQGPPGTGKSHTIANLICHLLAIGKRVLVTSQTPRALRVLKEKIPDDLTALAVVVLGNDARGLADLEDSVRGITDRHASWNLRQSRTIGSDLGDTLDRLRSESAACDRRLLEVREAETREYAPATGYGGTAMRIAQLVNAHRSGFAWFMDHVSPSAELEVSPHALMAARDTLCRFPESIAQELRRRLLPTSVTMPPTEFSELVLALQRLAGVIAAADRDGLVSRALLLVQKDHRHEVANALRVFLSEYDGVANRAREWIQTAVSEVLQERDRPWMQLLEDSSEQLRGLADAAKLVQHYELSLPAGVSAAQLLADARDLREHLASGHGLGVWKFRASIVRRTLYLIEGALVNGRRPEATAVLDELILFLETNRRIDRLRKVWSGVGNDGSGTLARQVRELEEHVESLEAVLALGNRMSFLRGLLESRGISQPLWSDRASVQTLLCRIEVCDDIERQASLRDKYDSCLSRVRAEAGDLGGHPTVRQTLDAVERHDALAYAAAIADAARIREMRIELDAALGTLEEARKTLPNLVAALEREPHASEWPSRIPSLHDAWNWAAAAEWLRQYEEQHDVRDQALRHTKLQQQIRVATAKLAAEKAWQHCFGRMTEDQRQHLIAWSKTVKQIGKGTGKYAPQRRGEAQTHMEKCRGAIPAWIMPFHRVAETVPAQPEIFDVIIVDEASQSGPETLLLSYLGKQLIIVGDDQQISPEYVGMDREAVDQLLRRHLSDFEMQNTFSLDHSLFTHAEIRYGNRVVLREHFRCMPEIIRFSNDLSYRSTPLIPLRQYPPLRLDPVVATFVESGYRDGDSSHALNKPEAEAVVAKIVECCSDPRYAAKTIGVISLQGEAQAQLIERRLLDLLDPKTIEARRIVCGDAYAFQGDERDIMFLSLVAAPNRRIAALTKETDRRRFNVAASRARDQMWLFHSVLDSDLNPDDFRARLLRFATNPLSTAFDEPDFEVCDSQFERDVARQIFAREYRLRLQYEALGRSGYRIDIVVEGEKTRLAVECDGDRWHGPDRYEQDVHRQRQLERAGWTFWRVRGSEYYANPDAALGSLWRMLDQLGIEPLSGARQSRDSDSSVVDAAVDEAVFASNVGPASSWVGAFENAQRADCLLDEEQEGGGVAGDDDPISSSIAFEQLPLDRTPHLTVAIPAPIEEVPLRQIRSVMQAVLATRERIARAEFLREVAGGLGYRRMGHNIKARLNKTLHAEQRAGRIGGDWEFIARP